MKSFAVASVVVALAAVACGRILPPPVSPYLNRSIEV